MTGLHRLKRDRLEASVMAEGGALAGLTFDGIDLLVPAGGPRSDMASFPLVPFGNRLEFNRFTLSGRTFRFAPNAADPLYLHGDGWLKTWAVEMVGEDAAQLSLRQQPDGLTPYDYTARQRISIGGDAVWIELSVRNEAETALPFGLGHHPFFRRTPGVRVTAAVGTFFNEREGHLPGEEAAVPADLDLPAGTTLPRRFFNNAFSGWDGKAEILWPELGITATIDTSPAHDVAMLYAPADREDFFCFEPMTHLPNGHHRPDLGGLKILRQGEEMRSRMTIRFERH
ncbi:aldose 1-epimerase [Pseudomonas sp. R2.Fl]|nr:aldose 1-epimerase [Pseudomonas sp. R2.Fl]